MSVFATGNMSLYASNEEEEDFICSAPLLWDQFPTRKALLITLDAVCSKLGAPGTMLVCKVRESKESRMPCYSLVIWFLTVLILSFIRC